MTNTPLIAWSEIPVSNLEKSVAFYDAVYGWTSTIVTNMGPNPVAFLNGQSDDGGAHLYEGKAAGNGNGSTLHLQVSDTVEAAAERCASAGGQVMGPIVPIPEGRFQYALDLDGNSIGLFQKVST